MCQLFVRCPFWTNVASFFNLHCHSCKTRIMLKVFLRSEWPQLDWISIGCELQFLFCSTQCSFKPIHSLSISRDQSKALSYVSSPTQKDHDCNCLFSSTLISVCNWNYEKKSPIHIIQRVLERAGKLWTSYKSSEYQHLT